MKAMLLVCLVLGIGCSRDDHRGIVKKVGGCNKYGRCGVLLTDGHVCAAYMPVEGAEVECAF